MACVVTEVTLAIRIMKWIFSETVSWVERGLHYWSLVQSRTMARGRDAVNGEGGGIPYKKMKFLWYAISGIK